MFDISRRLILFCSLLFVIRISLFVSMMFLFYLIFSIVPNRIDAVNISAADIPNIQDIYLLPMNDQSVTIAAQFNQSLEWEFGNMPMYANDTDDPVSAEFDTDGARADTVLFKDHSSFRANVADPYPIDTTGVHRESKHHIFLVRHGLYFYTKDDSTSHLLRYGKYQARIAGNKIDKIIHQLIQTSGPLTRPIKLVSSTQTRAFETLYNIRLQLSNYFPFETQIIRDSGLTECIDTNRQRARWLYFVREYLQPVQSNQSEHTITIIASHGNLLSTFDFIIRHFINRRLPAIEFRTFPLPSGCELSHGQTIVYQTIGTQPIQRKVSFTMSEIPITVNHAQLKKDFYYEWAAMHSCSVHHGRQGMANYIRAGILDNVFGRGPFENTMPNYDYIVYVEMLAEYETHMLPMMMATCRIYQNILPFIQTNTNFGSFDRRMSPIPIPKTEEEQQSPLDNEYHEFSAYGMPYPVNNRIQSFRKQPPLTRLSFPRDSIHSQSRNAGTSYLTRLGVNQIRGVTSHIYNIIEAHKKALPKESHIYPVNIVGEPTVQSAESSFHMRSLLLSANYTVAEQTTDLGLEFNYFRKETVTDINDFTRVQLFYMLRQYLAPDKSSHPSLRVHILCGDGRLFTAFRQEMARYKFLLTPYTQFSIDNRLDYNALKHANAFFFETIGNDVLRLHDTLTLVGARGILDDQKIATDQSIRMSSSELAAWFGAPSGPCTLSYLRDNRDQLALAVVNSASFYRKHIAEQIKTEWDPYLAGLFIYACRLRLTQSGYSHTCGSQAVAAPVTNNTIDNQDTTASARGPSGDFR